MPRPDLEREQEGFEQAEDELVERASHGDQHAARRVIEDSRSARRRTGGARW